MAVNTNTFKNIIVATFEDKTKPGLIQTVKGVQGSINNLMKLGTGAIVGAELKQAFQQLVGFARDYETSATKYVEEFDRAQNAFMTMAVESQLFKDVLSGITEALNFVTVLATQKNVWDAFVKYVKQAFISMLEGIAYYVGYITDPLVLALSFLTGGMSGYKKAQAELQSENRRSIESMRDFYRAKRDWNEAWDSAAKPRISLTKEEVKATEELRKANEALRQKYEQIKEIVPKVSLEPRGMIQIGTTKQTDIEKIMSAKLEQAKRAMSDLPKFKIEESNLPELPRIMTQGDLKRDLPTVKTQAALKRDLPTELPTVAIPKPPTEEIAGALTLSNLPQHFQSFTDMARDAFETIGQAAEESAWTMRSAHIEAFAAMTSGMTTFFTGLIDFTKKNVVSLKRAAKQMTAVILDALGTRAIAEGSVMMLSAFAKGFDALQFAKGAALVTLGGALKSGSAAVSRGGGGGGGASRQTPYGQDFGPRYQTQPSNVYNITVQGDKFLGSSPREAMERILKESQNATRLDQG